MAAIRWITLRVQDLDRSKAFYGDFLGLEAAREFSLPGGMRFAFYQADGGMQIELIEGNRTDAAADPNISIGIAVSAYEKILSEARADGILIVEPQILGGQLECFFITDPDGTAIQIIRA